MPANDTYKVSRVVFAPEETIYATITDPEQLALWLAPEGVAVQVEAFDLRPGGGYRVLLNEAPEKGIVTSSALRVRFVDMIRDQKIVHWVESDSPLKVFPGGIRISCSMEDLPEGTCVRMEVRDTPAALRGDRLTGALEGALSRLAGVVERMPSASIIYSEAGAQSC